MFHYFDALYYLDPKDFDLNIVNLDNYFYGLILQLLRNNVFSLVRLFFGNAQIYKC